MVELSLSKKVWSNVDEVLIHECIEEAFLNKGYNVKNFHKSDRRNENGIDILCEINNQKIGFAVKKKPVKKDITQLDILLSNENIKKVYVYVDHPSKSFENHIEQIGTNHIEFWNWDQLHNELIMGPSIQYLRRYLLKNSLLENMSSVHKSLYKCRKSKYSRHNTSYDEMMDLWIIKDDIVKLRAILDHIHKRWGEILMNKTNFDFSEYNEILNTIFHELEIANNICGTKLKNSFIKFEEKHPTLLGLFWELVEPRSNWIPFTHILDSLKDQTDVNEFIEYSWLMPHEANIMKGFYSSLYYILENLYEVSQKLEYGIDRVFESICLEK